jgi:hypothetical protein
MKETKYTKGSWKVAPDLSIYSDQSYYKIAEIVAGDNDGECEANAQLIASAPDLVKTIEDFQKAEQDDIDKEVKNSP